MKYRYWVRPAQVPTFKEWVFRVWRRFDYYAYEKCKGFCILGFKFSSMPQLNAAPNNSGAVDNRQG